MSIDGAPVAQPVPREIVGAMSAVFNDGGGPSGQYIDSAMGAAGLDAVTYVGNKAVRVRNGLSATPTRRAWKLLDELVHVTRDRGYFNSTTLPGNLIQLQAAISMYGGHLTDNGHMTWGTGVGDVIGRAMAGQPPVETPRTTLTVPATPPTSAPNPGLSTPTHPRLLATLRQVPEAVRPFNGVRRSGKASVPMVDEYDLQDAVQFALRLIYDDVRAEERSPSYAGSSTIQDFFVPIVGTMVEVKVTRRGRANRHIRDEILIDTEAYQAHPDVRRMVFVIYDLAGTISNPAGMESQMSRTVDGYPRDVLVVRWPAS
jgi:hypothetical protein